MFSNKDLKNLIVPLFLEQLLMALVGIADVFCEWFCRGGCGIRSITCKLI